MASREQRTHRMPVVCVVGCPVSEPQKHTSAPLKHPKFLYKGKKTKHSQVGLNLLQLFFFLIVSLVF